MVTVGCFRKPQRKRGIRGNQSTATIPILKWPPDQFAVLQLFGRERLCVCPARPGARAANRSADWLITRSGLSLHRTLIWPSNVAYFSGTGEFSELSWPPAEISGLSFLRRACENSLIATVDTLFHISWYSGTSLRRGPWERENYLDIHYIRFFQARHHV